MRQGSDGPLGMKLRRVLLLLVVIGVLSVAWLSWQTERVFTRQAFRRNASVPVVYMLVRAFGNALPPRHDPSRALQNLRFILEKERLDDHELATHWVINKLLDEQVAQQVREMLVEFGAEFTEIEMDLEQYAAQPFHVVLEDQGVDWVHKKTKNQELWTKVQGANAVYGSKNRYALGINVARNTMLNIARKSGAEWLLP